MKVERIFLELNGEALTGPKKTRFDEDTVKGAARQIKFSVDASIQVGITTGGGNFWRGRISEIVDRTKANQVGMLVTVTNCIYTSEIFGNAGMMTQILTPFAYDSMTGLFSKDRAGKHSERGTMILFAGRIGHPYFSIDTGIALRTVEMGVDCILLAEAIDGMYDSDPKLNPETKKYDTISIQEIIDKQLAMVDLTASVMCMEHKMPMVAFSLDKKDGIADAVQGRTNGTTATA